MEPCRGWHTLWLRLYRAVPQCRAHVAGAFSAAFALLRLLPERRWVGWMLLALAVLIATATIYGRYHYAADALAGLAISVGAYWMGVAGDRGRAGEAG